MPEKIHRAKETSGSRFQAVMDADGHVRLAYKRSAKTWILFDLDFGAKRKSSRKSFSSRADVESWLAVESNGGPRGSIPKEIFEDLLFEGMERV
jgi:hypothetical protein